MKNYVNVCIHTVKIYSYNNCLNWPTNTAILKHKKDQLEQQTMGWGCKQSKKCNYIPSEANHVYAISKKKDVTV